MKNSSYKHYLVGFVYYLISLVAATSLFAAQYNEPRKVLYSKYKNALYKNLFVTGEMLLNIKKDSDRIFLMEIGKRPTYFWDSNNVYHLFQTQTLQLNDVQYADIADTTTFEIGIANLPQGVFLSENGFTFNNLVLTNNNAGAIIRHSSNINFGLTFTNSETDFINLYSNDMNFNISSGFHPTIANTLTIKNLKTRDLNINGVKFVSPRMTIKSGSTYTPSGTARDFELYALDETDELKSYYGDWEYYAMNSCGSYSSNSDTCRKYEERTWVRDTDTGSFECVGVAYNVSMDDRKPYDLPFNEYPNGFCYDYLLTSSAPIYNYPIDPYEFKVQEILRVPEAGNPVLIDQTPKFRTIRTNDNNKIPTSINTGNAWAVYDKNHLSDYIFWVNEAKIENLPNLPIIPSNNTQPCVTVCNGQSCTTNRLYIRDNRQIRVINDNGINVQNHWALSSEQQKNKIAVAEYTIGVCPAISSSINAQYAQYEQNYNANMMNGIIVQSGNNFVAPQVCLRRKVLCSHGQNDGNGIGRNYKLLSTDY